VQEDIILPHHHSFYELIINKVGVLQQCHPGTVTKNACQWPAGVLALYGLQPVCRSTHHRLVATSDCCATYLQARGKSGPLFDFGVHEDIRVVNDASREKNESHAGKVRRGEAAVGLG
jgi:hypothetical protein